MSLALPIPAAPDQGLPWRALPGWVDTRWAWSGDLAWAEYARLGSWAVVSWERTRTGVKLKLAEPRGLSAEVPALTYQRGSLDAAAATYPNLSDHEEGTAVPVLYGLVRSAPAVCVDTTTRTFRLAAHALTSIETVYLDGVPVVPATEDAAAATFTLAAWDGSQRVTADAWGQPGGDGVALVNPADVVEDLLTRWGGETAAALDAVSFAAARAAWRLGVDRYGREAHRCAVSLWLGSAEPLGDVLEGLLGASWGLLYQGHDGTYQLRAWEPLASYGLLALGEDEVFELRDRSDAAGIVTRVAARCGLWASDDSVGQVAVAEDEAARLRRGLGAHKVREAILPFSERSDALSLAARTLYAEASPLRTLEVSVGPRALLLEPGDQVGLEAAAWDVDGVYEVLEASGDPREGKVDLVLGDRRGHADRPGFWVADAAVFPTELGGGSAAAWDDAWTDAQKTWARRNVGFWSDANGYADTTDPESRLAGVWSAP